MNNRLLLFLSFSVLTAFARQPNVILILTDDQGYGDMSCNGNPQLKTPAMDALHDESVQLEDFHVDPMCAPTRAALMTGKYSTRVGVWHTIASRHHLKKGEMTMADAFRGNGYRTGFFGKWHLGDNYPFRPQDRGFDEVLTHGSGVIGETADYWGNDYYDDVYLRNGTPEQFKGYCTDVFFDEATRFVEQHQHRPFFLYLPLNAPHSPFNVPERYAKPYLADKSIPVSRAKFYGMLANIDENLGRFRSRLQELSLDDNTLIIYMNDNGTSNGAEFELDGKPNRNGWAVGGYNAGMRGMKTKAWEGGHRAACFLHWPAGGLDEAKEFTKLCAQFDLFPTVMDLCGLELPRPVDFDGISLAPFLKEKGGRYPERTLVVHNQSTGIKTGDNLLARGRNFVVMKDRWRLVGKELFDLDSDPGQRTDVAQRHPELVQNLQKAYDLWWEDISVADDIQYPPLIDPAKQRVTMITSQSLLGDHAYYSQEHVRAAKRILGGYSYIDVVKPGNYKITVCRWPRELDEPMNALLPMPPLTFAEHDLEDRLYVLESKALEIVNARVTVGGVTREMAVKPTDKNASFDIALSKGEQRISTELQLKDGTWLTAYYTYIEPAE